MTDRCRYLVEIDPVRRPGNVICVEPIQPVPRCQLKPPKHWGKTDEERREMAVRWLWSGGDGMVLGICSRYNCPLDHEHKNSYPRVRNFTSEGEEALPEIRDDSRKSGKLQDGGSGNSAS